MNKIITALILVILSFGLVDTETNNVVEHNDVWYRTLPDQDNPGDTLLYKIDMSYGYAFCNGQYIYLIMDRLDEDRHIIIAFENYSYWYNEGSYWITPEKLKENKMIEEEINSLDEYLQKNSNNNKIESIK